MPPTGIRLKTNDIAEEQWQRSIKCEIHYVCTGFALRLVRTKATYIREHKIGLNTLCCNLCQIVDAGEDMERLHSRFHPHQNISIQTVAYYDRSLQIHAM